MVADSVAIATLRNVLYYESKFCDDPMLNTPPTLEDTMHRATRFIKVEEERVAIAKKHAPPKALISKDKPRDDYYEPRQHYDKDYQKYNKGKKTATYYVSNAQPQRPWNKYVRNDKVHNSQPYCDSHKR